MKKIGRCHGKSWLTCPPTKWQTNTDGHKSSTETGCFSLHQSLVFPCVWATIIHGTGVPVPPPARLPPQEVMKKMMPQEQVGKVVTRQPTMKASLGWKNGKLWLGLWMSTGVSTEDGWRPQVKWFGCRPPQEHIRKAEGWRLYPLMLADSEPKEGC